MIGCDANVVAPRSIMDKTEVRTPRTAPISWPLTSAAAGTAKSGGTVHMSRQLRWEPYLGGSCRMARIALPPAELSAAIVLQRQGTIVIMKACKLFSRRRVATTACAVLPAPGIVG